MKPLHVPAYLFLLSVCDPLSILQIPLRYVRVLELDLNVEKSTELLYDARDRFTDEGRILHVEMTHKNLN